MLTSIADFTDLALGAGAAGAIYPDILGDDCALLGELEELPELIVKSVRDPSWLARHCSQWQCLRCTGWTPGLYQYTLSQASLAILAHTMMSEGQW